MSVHGCKGNVGIADDTTRIQSTRRDPRTSHDECDSLKKDWVCRTGPMSNHNHKSEPMSTASGSPLPTAFNPTTCLRRGLCSVPTSKHDQRPSALNNTHPIYYEQHGAPGPGSDPITGAKHKIVFIMGLNTSCFSWGPQVRYFGGLGGDFTALVFDNRGVGNSGYPRGPYKRAFANLLLRSII